MPNSAVIGSTVTEISWFSISKMATVRHLGFILRVRVLHAEHLVVFFIVQNLVRIDAVVSIICMFFGFASLASKCLFTPQKLIFFWGGI